MTIKRESGRKPKGIEIQFDEEHEPSETVREVLRLVEEGCSSGIDPTWTFVWEKEE